MTTISLSKPRTLAHANGLLDHHALTRHVNAIKSKSLSTLTAYQANTGKPHPWALDRDAGQAAQLSVHLADSSDYGQRSEHNVADKRPCHHPQSADGGHGDIPLTDFQELLWVGKMTLGDGNEITIDFDTGSADTVVNKSAFKPGKDAKRTGDRFSNEYTDGTKVAGEVWLDNLQISDLKSVPNVAIGKCDQDVFNAKAEGGNVGVAGMAYPSVMAFGKKYEPFLDSLWKGGALRENLFSFALHNRGSELTLGAISDKVKGNITWVDIDSDKGLWVPKDISVNGRKISAYFDTGTTIIETSKAEARSFFATVPELEIFETSDTVYGRIKKDAQQQPKITFDIGGKQITLDEDSLVAGKDDNGAELVSIVGVDLGYNQPVWVCGDSLLRNFVSIWDRGNDRFGLADSVLD